MKNEKKAIFFLRKGGGVGEKQGKCLLFLVLFQKILISSISPVGFLNQRICDIPKSTIYKHCELQIDPSIETCFITSYLFSLTVSYKFSW